MNSNQSNPPTMDTTYKRLTGISIAEQLTEWDARGKGYYGEFLLFSEIYKRIPGFFKILMNLRIPSQNGKTTEIDLLLIHETGLYVFEAKHYKSKIYGQMNDPHWTQFFKTENNHVFPNPVFQNRWHIEQLRNLVPDIPIHSFIVFTSDECELKVIGDMPNTTLCKKNDICQYFAQVSRQSAFKMSIKKIDDIFTSLKIYSPMQKSSVNYEDNREVDFYQFVEMLKAFHSEQKAELEHSYATKEQELEQKYVAKEIANKKKMQTNNLLTVCACIAIMLFMLLSTSGIVSENQKQLQNAVADANSSRAELQKFMGKWEVITDFEIQGEKLKENYVTVDYAYLTNSADFADVVNLSFEITHNGEDFYVLIDKSSMFTIVLKDGRVIETPCYNSYYSYSLGYSKSTKILEVKDLEFSGFSTDDVEFIKMTNLQIKRIKYVYGDKPLLTDYEIILYTAD